MAGIDDSNIAARFTKRLAKARRHLRREMAALGLHARDGWRIAETVRMVEGGSEIVMWPIHRTLPSPEGVECVVSIESDGATIDSNC
jgi:hypothetical protein